MEQTIPDRSHLFNNAGVRMMGDGNLRAALQLFRGALDTKLYYERSRHPIRGVCKESLLLLPIQQDVSLESIAAAERYLAQYSLYLEEHQATAIISQQPEFDRDPDSVATWQARWNSSDSPLRNLVVPEESRGYSPYFYDAPFQLRPEENASTELTSAIIIFNLGLVHHQQGRNSPKAAAFYEISAALLAPEPDTEQVILLKVALLNNFGIWCFENGDGESFRTCMEHASTVVSDYAPLLIPDVIDGVSANVRWLLLPPNGGSPAA